MTRQIYNSCDGIECRSQLREGQENVGWMTVQKTNENPHDKIKVGEHHFCCEPCLLSNLKEDNTT